MIGSIFHDPQRKRMVDPATHLSNLNWNNMHRCDSTVATPDSVESSKQMRIHVADATQHGSKTCFDLFRPVFEFRISLRFDVEGTQKTERKSTLHLIHLLLSGSAHRSSNQRPA